MFFVIGAIGNAFDGDKKADSPSSHLVEVQAKAEAILDAYQSSEEKVEEEPREAVKKEEPKEKPRKDNETVGGITYGIAVQVCDAAAQSELFPGADYDPSHILGKQKGQVGLSDDQFLAVYNVKVDGRKTAITCLVDGTKDAPNVISVREFEAR